MSENPDRTAVAKDVFTYCTKEKHDTWHVVIAQNAAGVVDRVVCKSCRAEHKYRKKVEPKPLSARAMILRKPAKATSSSVSKRPDMSSAAIDEQWFKGVKVWGDKDVPSFDPATTFEKGDVFEHEVFGKGVVQGRRESRIDVLFKEGLKTLPSKLQA